MKQITIKDIARMAGVSIATVSYVLNNKEGKNISDETRLKVIQVTNFFNYKISNKRKIIVWIKESISRIVLFFLYRGIKVLYKKDSRVKEELDALEDGFSLEMKTSINGPKLIIKKEIP